MMHPRATTRCHQVAESLLKLPDDSVNGAARAAALAKPRDHAMKATSLVGYSSNGRLLVIGPRARVEAAVGRLAGSDLKLTALVTDSQPTASVATRRATVREILAPVAAIRGHLGQFEIDVQVEGEVRALAPSVLTANQPFDLVLDLSGERYVAAEQPPPGYYAISGDETQYEQQLEAALCALPELIGEFQKPRYFHYEPDICAHGERGQRGCTRCLDACPTAAIHSIGERIEVDPHLCQGAGSCATACPTGAIQYAFPHASDLIDDLRTMLSTFRAHGGRGAVILMHAGQSSVDWFQHRGGELPHQVLPVALEEPGAAGLEVWLSSLAFGASAVRILVTRDTPRAVRRELTHQIGIANAVLLALGYGDKRVAMHESNDEQVLSCPSDEMLQQAATFAGVDEKRAQLRLAMDHLHAHAPTPAPSAPLAPGAPFGRIEVDTTACTLCLSCVSVCPAGAVLAGGSRPELGFIEQNCVQCALCANACPEQAIALEPRIVFDPHARAQRQVLMRDVPFHCVGCGKPFATTRTIERMLQRLSSHWMYQDKPEQMARLKMCEDCRVKDMFADGGGLLDPHDR